MKNRETALTKAESRDLLTSSPNHVEFDENRKKIIETHGGVTPEFLETLLTKEKIAEKTGVRFNEKYDPTEVVKNGTIVKFPERTERFPDLNENQAVVCVYGLEDERKTAECTRASSMMKLWKENGGNSYKVCDFYIVDKK